MKTNLVPPWTLVTEEKQRRKKVQNTEQLATNSNSGLKRGRNNISNNTGEVYRKTHLGMQPVNNRQVTGRGSMLPKNAETAGCNANSLTPQFMKNSPDPQNVALHFLSERIKKARMQKVIDNQTASENISSGITTPRVAPIHCGGTTTTTTTGPAGIAARRENPNSRLASEKGVNDAGGGGGSGGAQRIIDYHWAPSQDTRQILEIISKQTNKQTNKDHQDPEYGNEESDGCSSSFAYLQKVIDNPLKTIVQNQISGNTCKMLVKLTNREQRLITFDIPKRPCSVQHLLEQASITFNEEITVSLVTDRKRCINYIVEGCEQMNQEGNESGG